MSDRDLGLGNFLFGTLAELTTETGRAVRAPALRPDVLYLGDNGRAFCGLLACAGMTAYWSGHDLSGEAVAPLTPQEAHEYRITCEGCGMQPMLVTLGRM